MPRWRLSRRSARSGVELTRAPRAHADHWPKGKTFPKAEHARYGAIPKDKPPLAPRSARKLPRVDAIARLRCWACQTCNVEACGKCVKCRTHRWGCDAQQECLHPRVPLIVKTDPGVAAAGAGAADGDAGGDAGGDNGVE